MVKYTISYVHRIDILMWGPIKLNFPFCDFSIIQPIKRKIENPPIETTITQAYIDSMSIKFLL